MQQTPEERIWLKSYDKGVPYEIECTETRPYDFLKNSAEKIPDRDALIFFNFKLKYKDLKRNVDSFASFLRSLGVGKGDRVAIDLPNCPQYIIAFYAVNKIGAVVVQISPTYFEVEINNILSNSEPKVLIILDDLLPRISQLKNKFPGLAIVATRIEDYLSFPLNFLYNVQRRFKGKFVKIPGDIKKFTEFKSYAPGESENVSDDDVAVLQYTGGTTGIPKGAMLTNRNLVCNTTQAISVLPGMEFGKDNMLSVIPFFHVFGMTVAMNFPVKMGGTMIIQPKPEVEGIIKLIGKYKPTFFPGVPTLYANILLSKNVNKVDMKSVKFCISGSAPLPVEIIEKWQRVTGGHIVEGYGLTEASPVTHVNPLFGKIKPGSIGLPVPSTLAKIVDITTGEKEMGIGEEGELIVKGPQVMKGYYKNEEETRNVLRDGWLYTGDIAKMDEEGYFYIVDRKKDVIIVGGFNVYPREVEEILYQNPKVKEAAAVGVKDEIHGEVVKAFVVLKDGETATEQEIKDFFQGKIAKFKIPRFVEFRKELPKTMVGKVLRRELREDSSDKSGHVSENLR
ncbi:MAG: long-chain fatty acid--CoA ligase [Thermoplasmatales archaeon]